MKNVRSTQSSSAAPRAASARFILTGLIAAAASFALPTAATAQISTKPFTLDGIFTNGPGNPGGEWGDVIPSAFKSTPGGTTPTTLADPTKNTLLYAALSHNVTSAGPSAGFPLGDLQLHLMYDFLPRTLLLGAPLPGEKVASVTFPVTLPAIAGRPKDFISVVFMGNGLPSFFDVFVDLDVNNPTNSLIPITAPVFAGLSAVATFGPSTLTGLPHLLVELEVKLRIAGSQITAGSALDPSGTLGGAGGAGINPATGMYDPNPVFWGTSAGGDGNHGPLAGGKGGSSLGDEVLQNATSVVLGINGNGSLAITPTPEPTSAALLLGSLGLLGARRRRA